jgi:hypothetical protein
MKLSYFENVCLGVTLQKTLCPENGESTGRLLNESEIKHDPLLIRTKIKRIKKVNILCLD